MILDERNEFSDAQAVTTSAISDVIDLGATPTLRSPALEGLFLVVSVDVAVTRAAGAATVTFTLESDSAVGLDSSATVHFSTAAISKADLTAGVTVVKLPLPVAATYERYLGVRYTVSATLDTGSFSAFLTPVAPVQTIYPDAAN